jgi:hypothetical protein
MEVRELPVAAFTISFLLTSPPSPPGGNQDLQVRKSDEAGLRATFYDTIIDDCTAAATATFFTPHY